MVGALYPIQPDIALNTHNYHDSIIQWNPLTENRAIYFQFTVLENGKQRFCMLPDGCIELLFRISPDNPQMSFFGKRTKAKYVELEPGYTYFGFRPFYEAGFKITSIDYLELIDQTVELNGEAEYERLQIALANAHSFAQRCDIFTKTGLFDSFWDKTYRYNHVVECSHRICMSCGTLSVGDLGDDLGYSNRHLRRSYKNTFGITPVHYKEIIRFQSSVHLLARPGAQQVDFARLSCESGYYDQSYMISDYKKFTEMTPKKLKEMLFAG